MKNYIDIHDFLRRQEVKPSRALVAGSKVYEKKEQDRRQLYERALGVDMQPGKGVDLVHNLEQPLPESVGRFDHIDCVSMLEHCQRPWQVAENLKNVLVPHGTLLVSAPFVWRVHGYPSDYWRFTIESYEVLFPHVKWLERGYLTENGFHKITGRIEKDGVRYLQRCEAVGFGILLS